MKAVLDTNVIISALISRSATPPARILSFWQTHQLDLVLSEAILQEYSRVLRYPHIQKQHKKTHKELEIFIQQFRQLATLVYPTKEITIVKQGPDDNKFLACAIAGKVQYIVSGDSDLLQVGEYNGIHILLPTVFLRLLEEEKV